MLAHMIFTVFATFLQVLKNSNRALLLPGLKNLGFEYLRPMDSLKRLRDCALIQLCIAKRGTVGRFLPKIDYKLSPVEGLATGGRLWVKGPNIMKGYILHDKPNYIVKLKDGWHDTGDIVDIDEEGYVSILDRAKRFAKIAGEMVSLSAVEKVVSTAFPKHSHAVLSIPCPKKGEQLVLFTDDKTLDKKQLLSAFKKAMASDLWVPKRFTLLRFHDYPQARSIIRHYKQYCKQANSVVHFN